MRPDNHIAPFTERMHWIASHPNDPWLQQYIDRHNHRKAQEKSSTLLTPEDALATIANHPLSKVRV
jgi:hypothetical protein